MKNRGTRGNSSKKPSNFKQNMQTLGIKTTGIVFGVPHFVVSLIGHEIAQTEAVLNYLIEGKELDSYTQRRKMLSETYRETMEEKIQDALETTSKSIVKFATGVQGVFTKKPAEAPQA